MSDRFLDGFYWMTYMGMTGENGVNQINRQDVAGWSFIGIASNYMLAGPPGWTKGSAALRPHPDWFTTVLWKQLMGTSVLNFKVAGDAEAVSNVTIHGWCSMLKYGKSGSVTIAFVVGWANAVTLTVPTLTSLTPRTEYILTSSAQEYNAPPAFGRNPNEALPTSLFDDAIFLNGVRMTVDDKGLLPQFPIPGKTVTSGDLVLPAYSYGYIVFPDAGVAACR